MQERGGALSSWQQSSSGPAPRPQCQVRLPSAVQSPGPGYVLSFLSFVFPFLSLPSPPQSSLSLAFSFLSFLMSWSLNFVRVGGCNLFFFFFFFNKRSPLPVAVTGPSDCTLLVAVGLGEPGARGTSVPPPSHPRRGRREVSDSSFSPLPSWA